MITLVECAQLSAMERAILERFAAQAKEVFRDNLASIILFGARGETWIKEQRLEKALLLKVMMRKGAGFERRLGLERVD